MPDVGNQERPQETEPPKSGWGIGALERQPRRSGEPLPQRGPFPTQDSNQRFNIYGDSGYRATAFDPNEFQPNVAPLDESTSATGNGREHARKSTHDTTYGSILSSDIAKLAQSNQIPRP